MKEFDIYLRKRLTECDIIVYSIPFRDGITVIDRMIINSCVEHYLLQKFIAVQTGSELVQHIDEMLKVCYEKLQCGVQIGTEAEFSTHYSIKPEPTVIELTCSNIEALETTFERAENTLLIATAPLLVSHGKSPGRGHSGLVLSQSVQGTLKTSVEQFANRMTIGSEVDGTFKQNYEQYSHGIELGSDLLNLCYRVHRAADTALEIAAAVHEIELHYSLGGGSSSMVIGSEIPAGDAAYKFFAAESAISILAELTESIIQYMAPVQHKVLLHAEAGSMLRRYRLLGEMDTDELSAFDDMTLDELDYIILEE